MATTRADKTINIRVLTSQGLAVSDEAVSLRVPGALGSFGVLRNHAPMVSTLTAGRMSWRHPDGTERAFLVGEGILEITRNQCTVLTGSLKEETILAS